MQAQESWITKQYFSVPIRCQSPAILSDALLCELQDFIAKDCLKPNATLYQSLYWSRGECLSPVSSCDVDGGTSEEIQISIR
jgi:hypothetical protein